MICIRLDDYDGALALPLGEGPSPEPGTDEVLVAVAAAGINPVDAKMSSGQVREYLPVTFPYIPGSDFCGTIVAVGEGVDPARIGERVMGMVDVQRGGAYAQLMAVPAARAVTVPEGIGSTLAAALPMGVMTGYDLIEIGLDVGAGETVLVTGAAGSVGRAAVFAAAERGATVVAVVRSEPEIAISGASSVILAGDEQALAQFPLFDCVADTVGGDLAPRMCARLRNGGRFATVVGAMAQGVGNDGRYSVSKVVVDPRSDALLRFAVALAAGRAALPPVRTYPLADASMAIADLRVGGAGCKLILTVPQA